jgi:hypothetical protein
MVEWKEEARKAVPTSKLRSKHNLLCSMHINPHSTMSAVKAYSVIRLNGFAAGLPTFQHWVKSLRGLGSARQ